MADFNTKTQLNGLKIKVIYQVKMPSIPSRSSISAVGILLLSDILVNRKSINKESYSKLQLLSCVHKEIYLTFLAF